MAETDVLLPWDVETDDDGSWATDFEFRPSDFDAFEDPDGVDVNPTFKPRIYKDTITRKVLYERAAEMADGVEVRDGARTFAFVSGNYIFGDLLEALIDQGKILPERIVLMSLSMSQENIDSLIRIREKTGCRIDLILSDYFYSHYKKNNSLVGYIRKHLLSDGVSLSFAGTHAKIILAETKDVKMVIHGSANLRSSRNIEQLSIECDRELFEFCDRYCSQIISAYNVTDKNPRGGKLWELMGGCKL